MQESELRTLFECGDLKSVSILKIPMTEHWYLQFSRKSGPEVLLDSQRTSPRRFKTLDAAFSTAETIGFRRACVDSA